MSTQTISNRRGSYDLPQILQSCHLRDGHYLLHNGRCSSEYYTVEKVLTDPGKRRLLMEAVLREIPSSVLQTITLVVGPQTWGDVLAAIVGEMLSLPSVPIHKTSTEETRFVVVKKALLDQPYVLRPAYRTMMNGQNALLVDTMRRTGVTSHLCGHLINDAKGSVRAAAFLFDFYSAGFDIPGHPDIRCLRKRSAHSYPKGQCPRCLKGEKPTVVEEVAV